MPAKRAPTARRLFRITPVVVLCALFAGCASSPSPLVRLDAYILADESELFLEVRGVDRDAPILLWLHGGPGGAQRPLFRYYNSTLEDGFLVAYWDQRGAGRSFDPNAAPELLTIERHLADLDLVVDHLRQTFGRESVVLIGHSWGSALGLLYAKAHPEKVSAFIGVAPVTATRETQRAGYDFAVKEATKRGDTRTLERLRELGPPPYATAEHVLEVERRVARYGGLFHQRPNQFKVALLGVLGGLVKPWEIPRFIRANNISLEAMHEELLDLDLPRTVARVDVPVFFFLGRYDRHVDSNLAADYFATLNAPVKRLIWFQNSAHNVPFEQPRAFNATVVEGLRRIGIDQK